MESPRKSKSIGPSRMRVLEKRFVHFLSERGIDLLVSLANLGSRDIRGCCTVGRVVEGARRGIGDRSPALVR